MERERGAEPRSTEPGISEFEIVPAGTGGGGLVAPGIDESNGIVKAEIQVGNHSVPYERSGHGSPVLLLLAGGAAEARPGATFQALARTRRVYRPTGPIPRSRDEAERWIRGLVEGLGLGVPDVVAEAEFAPLLARLVRRNDGLVGQVLFLCQATDADAASGTL
jgi:hypothetical protein